MFTEDQLHSWKEHAVTKRLFEILIDRRDHITKDFASPGYIHTSLYERQCAYDAGQLQYCVSILNMTIAHLNEGLKNYDEPEKQEDDEEQDGSLDVGGY